MWAPSLIDRKPEPTAELKTASESTPEHSQCTPARTRQGRPPALDARPSRSNGRPAAGGLWRGGPDPGAAIQRDGRATDPGACSMRIGDCGHLTLIERPDPVNA